MTEPSREWYVYVYYDPRNFQPFYIGKGKGPPFVKVLVSFAPSARVDENAGDVTPN